MIHISEETKQAYMKDFPAFEEACRNFYAGELKPAKYKGISGKFGSYGQHGAKLSMIRLRFTGGIVNRDQMAFLADVIEKTPIKMLKFTTGSSLQLHHLREQEVLDLYKACLEQGIYCYGAGGDNPRNITASPLRGLTDQEYFDVSPYVDAVGSYALKIMPNLHLSRKWKTAISGGFENDAHATLKDLGFVATKDGKFDVYSGGGMGSISPKLGLLIAEGVEPADILYYMEGFSHFYEDYGDHEHRGLARSRHIRDRIGDEKYKEILLDYVAKAHEKDLSFEVEDMAVKKTGPVGEAPANPRIHAQKQQGLYYVEFHPLGGRPRPSTMKAIFSYLAGIDAAEFRINTDETAYMVNLTAEEAEKAAALTEEDHKSTNLERSITCVGSGICQQGMRYSLGLLKLIMDHFKEKGISFNALPPLHISGCPSTCTINRAAEIGFRGAVKRTEQGMEPAYILYAGGSSTLYHEKLTEDLYLMTERNIPLFLEDIVGKLNGGDFSEWYEDHKDEFLATAEKYE